MAYSTKLSDALHVLVFIETEREGNLSSDAIARSLKCNPASVRQLMGRLRRAGIISCVTGLTRAQEEITMLDVYRAVEGQKPLLHLDTHVNPECGVGVNVQFVIGECFDEVQRQAESAMQAITLAEIVKRFGERLSR